MEEGIIRIMIKPRKGKNTKMFIPGKLALDASIRYNNDANNYLHTKCTVNYQFKNDQKEKPPYIWMIQIYLQKKNINEHETKLQTIRIYNIVTGIEIGIGKCVKTMIIRGERKNSGSKKEMNWKSIGTLRRKKKRIK